MYKELEAGFKLKSIDNRTVVIQKYLGSDGQCDVYLVDYNNSPMALKWYKKAL